MSDLVSSVIVSVVGFLIGGLLMFFIGTITAKFFAKRLIRDFISDETKKRFGKWVEDAFKNGIGKALQDEEIRNLIIEILKVSEKKLKGEDKKNDKL